MPSKLPEIKVRPTSSESLSRLRAKAKALNLSVAAYLLHCAGEPYPQHGGNRHDSEPETKKGKKKDE